MTIDVSRSHLAVLVSAINDAIKYNEALLRSQTSKDVSDYEEHLLSLENLGEWMEGEYRKLPTANPDLLTYEEIVRGSVFWLISIRHLGTSAEPPA